MDKKKRRNGDFSENTIALFKPFAAYSTGY